MIPPYPLLHWGHHSFNYRFWPAGASPPRRFWPAGTTEREWAVYGHDDVYPIQPTRPFANLPAFVAPFFVQRHTSRHTIANRSKKKAVKLAHEARLLANEASEDDSPTMGDQIKSQKKRERHSRTSNHVNNTSTKSSSSGHVVSMCDVQSELSACVEEATT